MKYLFQSLMLLIVFSFLFLGCAPNQVHYSEIDRTSWPLILFKGEPYTGEVYQAYNNGEIKEVESYKDGKKDGDCRLYYKDGKLKEISTWKNGKQDGEEKHYFQSGKLNYVLTYKDGKKHGKYIQYNEDGSIMYEYHYRNGWKVRE